MAAPEPLVSAPDQCVEIGFGNSGRRNCNMLSEVADEKLTRSTPSVCGAGFRSQAAVIASTAFLRDSRQVRHRASGRRRENIA